MTTRTRFFFFAAILGVFAHDGHAQTGVAASQVVCPASSVPVVAVALPPLAGGSKTQRIVCVPLDPASFRVDTSVSPPVIRAIGSQFVDGEIPSGTVDGTNAAYGIAIAPAPATSLRVYRNGVRQQLGIDYTLSGVTVTFLPGSIPQPGDGIVVDYRH